MKAHRIGQAGGFGTAGLVGSGLMGSGRLRLWAALGAGAVLGAPAAAQYGLSAPPVEAIVRQGEASPELDLSERDELPIGQSAIDRFEVGFDEGVDSPLRDLLEPRAILDVPVRLTLVEGVWYDPASAAGEGATVLAPIRDLPLRSKVFDVSALRVIARAAEDDLLAQDEVLGWARVALPPPRTAAPDLSQEDAPERTERVGQLLLLIESDPVRVDGLEIGFVPGGNPQLPDATNLLATEVTFGVGPEGALTQAGESGDRFETVTMRLDAIEPGPLFFTTGLAAIGNAITDRLRTEEQLIGILVVPDPEQIDVRGRTFEDLRELDEEEPHPLSVLVYLSEVRTFRTLAFGDRVKEEDRENAKVHQRVVERSTVKEGDLLRRDKLDEYLQRMNRLSGRRVSAALSPAEDEGVQVDYLISERNPLLIYGQVSNTGTEQTDRIRYRAGAQINQILNLDDTLTVDFISAGFDGDTIGFLGQYESDVPGVDRLRYRVEAAYSEFVASDVGLAGEEFTGDSTRVGAGLIWNAYQKDELFVDLLAGARWQNASTTNEIVMEDGDSDFFIPRVGVRMERRTRIAETFGFLTYEFNLPGVANTADEEELEVLGRIDVDRDFSVLRFGFRHSFYLEPLVNGDAWRDVSTPLSSTLAHEVGFNISGQAAMGGSRLIPQEEQVAGGLFTVRGYPESVVSGDTVVIVNAEYRFHVPRALRYSPTPGELFGQPFRWRPQEVYGEADWDLVLKAFVDAGWVDNQDRLPFETEETLVGAGVGVEFSFRRNLFARVDWGFALNDLPDAAEPVDEGDNEVHFVVTILF